MKKLIAAVKAFFKKLDDMNYKDYDDYQTKSMKAQLAHWKWQDEMSVKMASKPGSYADWYGKMRAVQKSRPAIMRPSEVAKLAFVRSAQ